ncbi:MAG: CheR family methyltransferase [Pseudomonadota bacterium]
MDSSASKNSPQPQANLSNDKFEDELLEVINRRLGIVVKQSQLTDLHQIVKDSCQKLQCSETDYLDALNKASDDSSILKDLINGITIGETYFFRDQKQMHLLKQIILPEIIARKRKLNDLSLRIWSAGCASGEELYSIVIMLDEMLVDLDAWHLHLLGTDINAKVLQKALSGQYSEWSMRAINDFYKNKYLQHTGQYYLLDKKIIKQAEFGYLNLNDHSYPSIVNGTSALDLILCRNVLIYFDAVHTREIMKKFSLCLVEGGYLLLGASDPVEVENMDLVLKAEHGKLLGRTSVTQATIAKTASKDVAKIKSNLDQIVAKPKQKSVPVTKIPEVNFPQLIKQSRWAEILNIIDQYPKEKYQTAEVLSAKAEALANLGRLKEAAEYCENSLKQDPIKLSTYFTYAMILIGLNEYKRAEAALRKTLFLDRDFVLGHYQLGLMLIRNNELATGLKSLKNAYEITQKKDATLAVPGYENLTYGKLTDILQKEIQLHEVESHETE